MGCAVSTHFLMALSPISPALPASASQLLLENVNFGLRARIAPTAGSALPVSPPPAALRRIEQLVGRLQNEIITGADRDRRSSQQSVDRTLAEIGKLVGSPLSLGGARNAVLTGLNSKQITGYEIRKLRPNASESIKGSISRSQRAALVDLGDIQDLLASGGSLDLNTSGRTQSIEFQSGESLSNLVRRINRSATLGVTAQAHGSSLLLSSRNRGAAASLSVTTNQSIASAEIGPIEISGLNGAQITALDTSALTAGVPITVSGSRDTLASEALLTYEGSLGSVAAGTASFQLTGPLGSANLSVTQGESLQDFATRINDESNTTGVEAEVIGNNLAIRSLDKGASASIAIDNISPDTNIDVTGTNASQVAAFNVLSFPDETQLTLSGTVTQAADTASQIYHGSAGGFVEDTAVFTLGGTLGTAQISITQGESLSDVAQRVNDETATTGVTATTSGDDLILESAEVGSTESVQVTLDSVAQDISVDGVNGSQVSNFQVVSAQPDSVNNLVSSVTQTATQGELTYTGLLNAATSSSNFTLTGELGNTTISVASLESLTSVRDKINAESGTTGISATASGDTLTLTSTGYGSAAIVEVDVNSGSFDTSGGDGNGNAAGIDAELNINGNTVTAAGHDVSYTDSLGSYTFTIATGLTGSLDTITVTSANGTFDVTGGDGSGQALGQNAEATINGQTFVANANDFSLNLSGAQFALTLVEGFSGALDPITVGSTFHDFTISGGNGDETADGLDGTATIDGVALSSASDTFVANTAAGSLTITFEESFLGAIDPISISYETLTASGGTAESFQASGSDAEIVVNGNTANADGGGFVYHTDGVEIALQFAKGFQGEFDPFTISAGGTIDVATEFATLTGSLRTAARSAVANLFSLAAGGENANAGTSRALNIAQDSLQSLRELQGTSASSGRRSLTGSILDAIV